MRGIHRWLTAALSFALIAPAHAQYQDADNLMQAAGMALGGRETAFRMRAYCVQKLPAHAREIDGAMLAWLDRHGDLIDAAESVIGVVKLKKYLQLAGPMLDKGAEYLQGIAQEKGGELVCMNLVARWQTGESDLPRQSPKAAAFLKEYVATHPVSPEHTQRNDDESGCIKQQWNSGRGLD